MGERRARETAATEMRASPHTAGMHASAHTAEMHPSTHAAVHPSTHAAVHAASHAATMATTAAAAAPSEHRRSKGKRSRERTRNEATQDSVVHRNSSSVIDCSDRYRLQEDDQETQMIPLFQMTNAPISDTEV